MTPSALLNERCNMLSYVYLNIGITHLYTCLTTRKQPLASVYEIVTWQRLSPARLHSHELSQDPHYGRYCHSICSPRILFSWRLESLWGRKLETESSVNEGTQVLKCFHSSSIFFSMVQMNLPLPYIFI